MSTHDKSRDTCDCCGGLRPLDPDRWDQYLARSDGYCTGHLATDDTGAVVGCGAWNAEAYEEEEEEEEVEIIYRAPRAE